MRNRLLLASAALLTLSACSESPTSPRTLSPGTASPWVEPEPDGTCRSGYIAATRSDGTVVCEEG